MGLLYIIGGIGIFLTVISGQYSDHILLFWSFLGCTAVTGILYSRLRQPIPKAASQDTIARVIALGLLANFLCFATFVLLVWLCIVIWI
jgi:hypothetical protein